MDGRYWLRRGFVRHFCVIISVQAHRALGGYRRLRTRTWLGLNSRQWISAEWTVVGSADAQQTAIHALAAGCADRRQSEALGPKVKGSNARQIDASYPNSAGPNAVSASCIRPSVNGLNARQIAASCPNSVGHSAAERKVALHRQAFRAQWLCAPCPTSNHCAHCSGLNRHQSCTPINA